MTLLSAENNVETDGVRPADSGESEPLALDIRNAEHSFGTRHALDNASLSVEPEVFCAPLGLKGAGKTMLFSLITRLLDNTNGVIEVLGFDVRRSPSEALRRLGVVQSPTIDLRLQSFKGADGQPRRSERIGRIFPSSDTGWSRYKSTSADRISGIINSAVAPSPAMGIRTRLAVSDPKHPPMRSAAYSGLINLPWSWAPPALACAKIPPTNDPTARSRIDVTTRLVPGCQLTLRVIKTLTRANPAKRARALVLEVFRRSSGGRTPGSKLSAPKDSPPIKLISSRPRS
jgi:hypothetical protein